MACKMPWQVRFTKQSDKQLSKLDTAQRNLIIGWLAKNLEGCGNPRLKGKPLEGGLSSLWSYRIGTYRVIADIRDDELIILLVKIGHRRDVYRR
jgi:mRNA interferase RelE/StbE